jgi:4-hydroxy-tetrahydrodipicolinate synthase
MKAPDLSGISPVMVTPLRDDGSLDLPGLEALVDYLAKAGFDKLVCLGSNGEFPYLTDGEKREVIETTTRAAGGRLKVIAGTGCFGTRETIALSRFAAQKGAAALLVALPVYYALKPEDVTAHYREVASEAGAPVIFYNFPGNTHLKLTPREVAEICAFEGVAGIKETVLNLVEIKAHRRLIDKPGFNILSGTSYLLKDVLAAGGNGVICPVPMLMPAESLGLFEAWKRGNISEVKRLQSRLWMSMPLMSGMDMPPWLTGRALSLCAKVGISLSTGGASQASMKEALRLLGLPITARVRSPLPQLTAKQAEMAGKIVKSLKA